MAGKRMLHENICESRKLSAISYQAETLYYRILTQVDDNGNFFFDEDTIKGRCFPRRKEATARKIAKWRDELIKTKIESETLLSAYEYGGDKYIHFNKFEEFQFLRSDLKADVRYPRHPSNLGAAPGSKRIEADSNVNVITDRSLIETRTKIVSASKVKENQVQDVQKEGVDRFCDSQNGDKAYADAKRSFHKIVGKSFGSLGRLKFQWDSLVSRESVDTVVAAVELWAREKKESLKASRYIPIMTFLKYGSEFIELVKSQAASPENSEAEASDSWNMPTVEDDLPPDYAEVQKRLKEERERKVAASA